MYLGNRKIRSAGRTSGSVEITLPVRLQILEGVECRLTVRDGSRPEIVLQPDLSVAQTLFRQLWQKLRLGLGEVGEIGDFSPADFTLALFPHHHWQERPPLAYADALAVLIQQAGGKIAEMDALSRLVAFLAMAAGYRLNLKGDLILAFGDAVAYLITGTFTGLGTDFERGLSHRTFWGEGCAEQFLGSPLDDWVWQQAQPALRRLFDQFHTWQENPETYIAARDNWYRALTMEMGMATAEE